MHETVLENRLGDLRGTAGACRSVGKPGNGAVDTVTGRIPAPFLATRMPSLLTEMTAPACASTSSADCSNSGRAPESCTSPPVMATAIA
jgi:hypothetical protein